MHSEIKQKDSLFTALPKIKATNFLSNIKEEKRNKFDAVIVLDDDPTGTQTVYDVPVLTNWDTENILNEFENPFEINPVIDEFVRMLFPKDISQNQKDYLKEVLIPGLPDFEWNVEYSEYFSDPGNETLSNGIINKIRSLLTTMMTMPEYQLS